MEAAMDEKRNNDFVTNRDKKIQHLKREISEYIEKVTLALNRPLKDGTHFFLDIPENKRTFRSYQKNGISSLSGAVYIFYLSERCDLTKEKSRFFKIGRVGPKSTARFDGHHYNPKSSGSNLAKSILQSKKEYNLNVNKRSVKSFIENNFIRLNILFLDAAPEFSNELVEAILHYKYNPLFEGPISQRKE